METVAPTKCEVVEIKIDRATWKAKVTIPDPDPYAEAVSFCADDHCTLLFLNPAVFDRETLFLESGKPQVLDVIAKGQTTEVRVLVGELLTAVVQAQTRVQVCGGPRIIVP